MQKYIRCLRTLQGWMLKNEIICIELNPNCPLEDIEVKHNG